MNDAEKLEKVIRGLEACVCDSRLMQCANCPYHTDKSRCVTTLMRDALAMLKEQEDRIKFLEKWTAYLEGYDGMGVLSHD
jgi:hypothetical protein